jgi:hypothetical protein
LTQDTRIQIVRLNDGTQVHFEVRARGGYEDLGFQDALDFDAVMSVMEKLTASLHGAIERAKPSRA